MDIDKKILKRLDAWEAEEGGLPKSLELYRKLLRIQSSAKLRTGPHGPGLSPEVISNRMSTGYPVLEFDDLLIDWGLLWGIFEEVNSLLSSYSEVLCEVPDNLKDSSSCPAFLKEAIRAWFEGSQSPRWIAVSGVNEAHWEFILHATLRPFLTRRCEALLNFVNQELWRRGYCPICGGSPDFAFLDKERGARWLLCSRCDAEWLFKRFGCPYCGTQDQDAQAYFTDDKGLYRLYVCERCRSYLKAIDLRQTESEVCLPLERILTLDMDIQAQKDGYSPGVKAKRGEGMEMQHDLTASTKEEG